MDANSLGIGVDLGGTKIDVALVDHKGTILNRVRGPTDVKGGPKAIIQSIISSVETLSNGGIKPGSIGIGIAGQIDAVNGTVRFAPNLGWRDIPLLDELKSVLGIPVIVTNDVRAATWGEWHFGAGKGSDDIVCLFVGTGIGGGVVSGGHMLAGANNCAGEFGHMTVLLGGRKCHCGNRGCLEAYAGGWAIAEMAREMIATHPEAGAAILNDADGRAEAVTSFHVFKFAHLGDPLAQVLINNVVETLAGGIVGLVNAFNPERFILSGGIINGMPQMISAIDAKVRQGALNAATEKLTIIQAKLKEDAGVVGAATLGMCNITF